jgi:hypothetical protein
MDVCGNQIFPEGHGKSLCGTCFSVLSRWLEEIQKTQYIYTTELLQKAWEARARTQSIKYTFIPLAFGVYECPSEQTILEPKLMVHSIHHMSSVLVRHEGVEAFVRVTAKALTSNVFETEILFKVKRKPIHDTTCKQASTIDRAPRSLSSTRLGFLQDAQRLYKTLEKNAQSLCPKSKKRAREKDVDDSEGPQRKRTKIATKKRSRTQMEEDSAEPHEDGDYLPLKKRKTSTSTSSSSSSSNSYSSSSVTVALPRRSVRVAEKPATTTLELMNHSLNQKEATYYDPTQMIILD